MNKLLITGCLLATAFVAVAMPNKKELAAAQKLVEDVIAPDVKALNAGRKTVKDVADAQMKLAADAQSEAEKYLLLQSAFKLYSRGEEFDSAAKALTAISRDIKDVPPELITELVNKEFNRDIGLKAPKEIEVAERAMQRQRLLAFQKEMKNARAARPVIGGQRRPRPQGETLRAHRLQRQQEAQAVTDQRQATVDGYTWSYCVTNGEVMIVSPTGTLDGRTRDECAVSPRPTGNVTIPSTLGGAKVTSIGDRAFAYCREMKSVTIPNSVTNIGRSAFYQCWSLREVTIPEGVVSIGWFAFEDCWHNLEWVTLPSTVTDIGFCAFSSGSGKMKGFSVSSSNPKYASVNGLLCSKDCKTVIAGVDGNVTIPDGVTTIGVKAFYKCCGLKTISIPGDVAKIESAAFNYCQGLTSVTMRGEKPDSGDKVFDKCAKLKSIHVPANAKSWAGMTEWQGIPLVFDEEVKGLPEMTPVEREFKIGAAPGTVVEVDIGECPLQFVSCPAGKFRMGYSEKPEVAACREIEITSPFWMTKGRLTMEQLRALGVQEGVTENKEGFACVNEASLMVEKLPQLLNKRFEGRVPEGYVFRLPTEAEFEYVQKAGAVGNDPRLAWGYSDDNDSVPNPWGVQKLFYVGRKDCFLDRVGGGKDVVSRFARNRHWTDLVSINYENQPSRDPVGWCEGNRWAVLRRERNRKLMGRGLYGSTFYFVLAPDESRLNKFIWK